MDATTDKDGIATFINNKVDYTNDFFMGKYYIKETGGCRNSGRFECHETEYGKVAESGLSIT